MKVGELFVDVMFNTKEGQKNVNDFIQALGNLDLASVLASTEIYQVAKAVGEIAAAAVAAATQISNLHTITGLSEKDFQQFGEAANVAGIKTETMVDSMQKLQMMFLQFRAFGKTEFTAWTGIVPSKDWHQTLNDFRKYLLDPKISDSVKQQAIAFSGLNQEMAVFLKSSDAIYNSVNTQSKLSDGAIKNLTELGMAWRQLVIDAKNFAYGIIAFIAPIFTNLLRLVDLLIYAFDALGDAFEQFWNGGIGKFFQMIANLTDAIYNNMRGIISLIGQIPQGFAGLSQSILPTLAGIPAGISSSIQTNHITIPVSGAHDPFAVAQMVGEHLGRIFANDNYQNPSANR